MIYKMNSQFHKYQINDQQDEEIMMKPSKHLLIKETTQFVHLKVCHTYNHWFQLSKDLLKKCISTLDYLASAVCILDDFQDLETSRHGILVTHLVYGLPQTFMSAVYSTTLVAKTNQRLFWLPSINSHKMIDDFIKLGIRVLMGQRMEIYFSNNFICPTEREYHNMVAHKTTTIYAFSFHLMKTVSDKTLNDETDAFERILKNVGLFVQVYNDYVNLASASYTKLRGFATDITEGKFSVIIVHAIQNNPNDDVIIDILKQRTEDNALKQKVIDQLNKYGSLDYTLTKLFKLCDELIADSQMVGGNPELTEFVKYAIDNVDTITM